MLGHAAARPAHASAVAPDADPADGPAASRHVVATDRALYLPGGVRLLWQRIDHAWWDDADLRVVTTEGAEHRVGVPAPGALPEVVRERVTASIVASRHVRLGNRGGVRLVARRAPGGDSLEWELLFDRGLDPDDPGLRALAEQALEEVRRSLGV